MKFLKWLLITVVALGLLVYFVGMPYARKQTKTHSPEETATYTKNGMDLSVHYSSPSKKGRVIFGELVPYDMVWRTGANEPTTFTTGTDLMIMGNKLPAGKYSLWSKPGMASWLIIFNTDIPDWGVSIMSGGKETNRNPNADVISVEVKPESLSPPMESLTIDFEDSDQLRLCLSWDDTKVSVPINK